MTFKWLMKSGNETEILEDWAPGTGSGTSTTLPLNNEKNVEYRCIANNSVGIGTECEIKINGMKKINESKKTQRLNRNPSHIWKITLNTLNQKKKQTQWHTNEKHFPMHKCTDNYFNLTFFFTIIILSATNAIHSFSFFPISPNSTESNHLEMFSHSKHLTKKKNNKITKNNQTQSTLSIYYYCLPLTTHHHNYSKCSKCS